MHIVLSFLCVLLYCKCKGGDNVRLIFKILIVVGIILAAPLSIALIWQNWAAAVGTTPISFHFDWLTQYEPLYLFWSGVILATFLVFLLFITLFWPRARSLYLHQKPDGQVTVSKKAIENFTLSALQQEPFIGNPRVSAKLSQNKIKLKISGDLLNSINAKQHTAAFLNQLKEDLRTCLGISKQKAITIRLVNFNASESNMKQSRVI
ncbi:hypothetical protein FD50_GL000340 [Liquorilactobacillus satsumensis DSM 16230 = JCM 12392]|uniref:Alkaline shock response membrane anchor protein AmaP n=1 Tax=Liquorilactobacillus satsumensis DSM 16230 = JCM 12392 TaxID=1423801 RepID=A0A0R1V5D3_9LACO|nr:hypothetical protein FD50_GL000340 [Liquorilactobacillus satsumensis DSM 16230 = JCM 12392]